MKEVVNENTSVNLDNVTPFRYYGTTCIDGKAFIARENYHEGYYVVRAMDSLTKGNSYAIFNRATLKDSIAAVLQSGYMVYEFNTPQELFKWLAE